MFIILIVVAALIVEVNYEPPVWLHLVIWIPLIFASSLELLRVLKSPLIALRYRHQAGVHPPSPHSEPGLSRVRLLPWPTIIAGPGLALLLGLGTWQLERLEWKNASIAERDSRMAAPVASFDNDSQPLGPLNFRRVLVGGEFLHHQEFHLLSRTSKGHDGIHVVTPLVPRPEIAGHPTILVNCGWVPNVLSDPGRCHEDQTPGIVRTEVGRQGWFAPENDPAGGVWHRMDVGQMSGILGLPLAPLVIEAGPALNPGGFPIGGQTRVQICNDHLGYAITWYTLAAALAIIYLLFARQKFMRQPMGTP